MPKIKSLNAIQAWMHTKAGQTFLNIAYSWGASIVILGALFKLTHIAGADLMLFIGMGTEVVVFFISGFDIPWVDDDGAESEKADAGNAAGSGELRPAAAGQAVVVVGTPAAAPDGSGTPVDAAALASTIAGAGVPQANGESPEMEAATRAYVEQLNQLTDILKQVAEQSARLTRDSEEMETMNRTLTGINRFYEMQLRSVGQQSATIDDVNTQTRNLAGQLEELNAVYARMVEALKMKMG